MTIVSNEVTPAAAQPSRSAPGWYATLTAWEPLWLLLLTPLLLWPGKVAPLSLHPALVAGVLLFWPLRLVMERRLLPPSPVNWPLYFLLLWLPVNIWAAADAASAWAAAGYLLLGIGWFGALVHWRPAVRHPQRIAWALLWLGAVLAFAGPLLLTDETTRPDFLIAVQGRLMPVLSRLGETINANMLANALVVIVPLVFALLLRPEWTRRRWLPVVHGALLLAMLAALYVTYSRGSQLALAIALPLVVVLRWPRLLFVVLPLGVIAGLYIGLTAPEAFLELMAKSSSVGGFDERVEIWSRAWYAIQDFPFTGVGIGAYSQVIPLLYPYFLIPPSVTISDSHNLFLQVGIDLGIPGFLAWLAIQGGAFWMLVRLVRRRTPVLQWALAAGLLGAWVATFIGGIFASVNWTYKTGFLPWILLALAVLLYRQLVDETPHA